MGDSMSLLTEAVAQEQRRIERMISQYETELSCLPKGVLITKSSKGNQYYYLQYRNGKKTVSEYIGRQSDKVEELQKQNNLRHILSYLPGVYDGKLCVLTDDKGEVGKIGSVMRKTNPHNRGARIIVFSMPKLVQHMFQEHVEISEDEMINLISQGASGNIVVMGTTAFDLKVDEKISMTGRELVQNVQ